MGHNVLGESIHLYCRIIHRINSTNWVNMLNCVYKYDR